MFSRRTSHPQAPNAFSLALEAARARGPVTDLTVSNPTAAGFAYPGAAIRRALSTPGSLDYAPDPWGLPAARAALSAHLQRWRGVDVPPARIMLTASTSEAYSFLFKALCDPGDEALVPTPSYPLLEHLAVLDGVTLVPYRLAYDGAWHVDAADVRARVTPRTRMVIAVSPNNPTGSILCRADLHALHATALPLVVDEVFSAYVLDEGAADRPLTALAEAAPLVVSLGGLSKEVGLPQAKLAWLALAGDEGPVHGLAQRLELVADTFLSVGTPVQAGLADLLDAGADVTRQILARTRANLAHARQVTHATAVSTLTPQGGWSLPLRLPTMLDDNAWALRLLDEEGVAVHPGFLFDMEQPAVVVTSLLVETRAFADGLRRLLACVARATT